MRVSFRTAQQRHDARDLRQDPPAEFVTAHSESTTLGVRQAKRPRAQVFSEDPILLPEIVDQIVLVTVHPASEREDEELQRRPPANDGHPLGRARVAKPSVEEPDAEEPARPDLWGAGVGNDPGLPDVRQAWRAAPCLALSTGRRKPTGK